jgi:hypothetical protein
VTEPAYIRNVDARQRQHSDGRHLSFHFNPNIRRVGWDRRRRGGNTSKIIQWNHAPPTNGVVDIASDQNPEQGDRWSLNDRSRGRCGSSSSVPCGMNTRLGGVSENSTMIAECAYLDPVSASP